jgi:hypothetical protein
VENVFELNDGLELVENDISLVIFKLDEAVVLPILE